MSVCISYIYIYSMYFQTTILHINMCIYICTHARKCKCVYIIACYVFISERCSKDNTSHLGKPPHTSEICMFDISKVNMLVKM